MMEKVLPHAGGYARINVAFHPPNMVLDKERRLLESVKALIDSTTGRVESFINNPQLISLAREYQKNRKKGVVDVGLNLFVLISDVYHRENFHSDILRVLLDPKSPHKEGDKYLHLFLEFLGRKKQDLQIDTLDFNNATVVREENRIDLLICDATSRKAIIIESKMNNAWDMPRQIPRYLSKVKSEGYQCEAIVYLRLNNIQFPDTADWTLDEQREIDGKLICVTAYTDAVDDLFNGWILKCEQASEHIDAMLILRQYGTLIRKLGGDVMNKPIMDEFYKMMLTGDNLKTAQSASSMLEDLILYRVQMLIDRFSVDLKPFTRIKNYQNYVAYFGGLTWNECDVGADIIVNANDYTFQVWDRNDPEAEHGRAESILQSLGYFDDLTLQNGRYAKSFAFPAQEQQLIEYVMAFKKQLVVLTKAETP